MVKKIDKKSKDKSKEDSAGLFIPAGCLIGLGVGLLVGNPGSGIMIGLGLGFLVMAIIVNLKKKK
ncbi:hypothetical protein KAS08_05925 [Candidatus Pacearchaeota archaeon]|nr:hypothetical protein [Candidatus Pacearchaeota archaeon]